MYRVWGFTEGDISSAWGWEPVGVGIQEESPGELVLLSSTIPAFLLYLLSTGSAQVSVLDLPLLHGPILLSLLPPHLGFDSCFPLGYPCIVWLLGNLLLTCLSGHPPPFCLTGFCFYPEHRWYLSRLIWTSRRDFDFGFLWGSVFSYRYSCRQFAVW